MSILILFCILLSTLKNSKADEIFDEASDRTFPKSFMFGVATAAYQIEGGWNADGKGESIWDYMTHNHPSTIKDNSNGDVASDSYNNYQRDVEMLTELGVDAYRFSLSWPRILPSGFANNINKAGIDYYNKYINEMIAHNITPVVTLYHWDLPQPLQELGGWANPLIEYWFADYAKVAFENFGDRVKHWITINEPREICYQGYGYYTKAPRVNATGIGEYICAKNLVIAHARVYHTYNTEFKDDQDGICGITMSINWFEPATDSAEDEYATELKRQSEWGIYAHPIFSDQGGFPKEITKAIADKSLKQKYPSSRLPELTEAEKDFVRGTFDFFGMNHYTSFIVSATEHKSKNYVPSMLDDVDVGTYVLNSWNKSATSWLQLAPNSLFKAVTHLSKYYNYPNIYVTEGGWSTTGGLDDEDRIVYYRAALEDCIDAFNDGIKLKGYFAWSLMDNFEWMEGYTVRFGLYEVDFNDSSRMRIPRKSALMYQDIISKRKIDYD